MKHIFSIVYNICMEKLYLRKQYFASPEINYGGLNYANRKLFTAKEVNEYIYDSLKSGEPFLVARFGATELMCSSMYEFDMKSKQSKAIEQLCQWSGFFPNDVKLGANFHKTIVESAKKVDMLGVWGLRWETYYIKKYMRTDAYITSLFDLEPWRNIEKPWTSALKGKKVLVVHPFENTIIEQYKKHHLLFPGTDLLPDFELKTLRAVQTVAGEIDDRFETWFDALEYMYQKAMEIDFDVAIIGCGAYGLPLAAKIKASGKQAIHLGGVTQILFGIRGKRWDEEAHYDYIRKLYNDSWVHPAKEDRPKNSNRVEGGCYW